LEEKIEFDRERTRHNIMTHEEKKVGKIVEELTMYFFSIGGTKIDTSIERSEAGEKITFRSNYDLEYDENIQYLETCLAKEKNEGMEDIYWELAGSGDPGESSQLMLIGMMIDSHEVHRYGNEVELILYKNKEYE